jgi:hypothetical protein
MCRATVKVGSDSACALGRRSRRRWTLAGPLCLLLGAALVSCGGRTADADADGDADGTGPTLTLAYADPCPCVPAPYRPTVTLSFEPGTEAAWFLMCGDAVGLFDGECGADRSTCTTRCEAPHEVLSNAVTIPDA